MFKFFRALLSHSAPCKTISFFRMPSASWHQGSESLAGKSSILSYPCDLSMPTHFFVKRISLKNCESCAFIAGIPSIMSRIVQPPLKALRPLLCVSAVGLCGRSHPRMHFLQTKDIWSWTARACEFSSFSSMIVQQDSGMLSKEGTSGQCGGYCGRQSRHALADSSSTLVKWVVK